MLESLSSLGRPAGARDVLDGLNRDRESRLAYTTVMTVMSRLADKGILVRERVRRGYSYEPVVRGAAEIAVRSAVRQFSDAVVGRGELRPAAAVLVVLLVATALAAWSLAAR